MKEEFIITEDELPADVMRAVKAGRKVVAIKLLREATGLGMANAKVLVDRASAKYAPKKPRQALMRDYNPTNTRLVGMLFLAIAAFAAYKFLFAA